MPPARRRCLSLAASDMSTSVGVKKLISGPASSSLLLKRDNAFGEEDRYGEKHRGLIGIAGVCRTPSICQREVAVVGASSAQLGGPGPHVKMAAHFCPVDW